MRARLIPTDSRSAFHADVLRSGLQDRVIVAPVMQGQRSWMLVLVQSGSLTVGGAEGERAAQRFPGPSLICQPVSSRMRLAAGSVGAFVVIDEFGMSAILGNKPEAAELRVMVDDLAVLDLTGQQTTERAVTEAYGTVLQETAERLPGHETMIESALRQVLVLMWRLSFRSAELESQDATQTILLRRFRQLIETRFRQRWRVTDYAEALGTTPDRLHNISTQVLGRAPLALIHERAAHEAKCLLERSNMTLDEVAVFLGFGSAAQFNTFFRKNTGVTPARYRKTTRDKPVSGAPVAAPTLADWP